MVASACSPATSGVGTGRCQQEPLRLPSPTVGYRPGVTTTSAQSSVRFDGPAGEPFYRRRRLLYLTSTVVLTLIVVSAVLEEFFSLPMYGVTHRRATATVNGTELTVRYPRVTRGQLDSPLRATVRRSSSFDGPVTIEIARSYLAQFTERRVTPMPTSEKVHGDAVVLTFDKPENDTLAVEWDLGARPAAWFTGVDGRATVIGDRPEHDVTVSFHTDLRP